MTQVRFHGGQNDAFELFEAVRNNCTCKRNVEGARTGDPCSLHLALDNDQRFIDGLLFVRSQVTRFLVKEFES